MSFQIESERLRIRPWGEDDRDAFEALATDPQVQRFMAGRPLSPSEIEETLARSAATLEAHGLCMGAMELKESGAIVGLAGLQPLGTTGHLEVGYWLEPALWGRGFATEAARSCIAHAFGPCDRSTVMAITTPDNGPSRAVMERVGMHYVRRCTGADLGHRVPELDLVLYEINRPADES